MTVCVASSGAWRILRREGEFTFVIQRNEITEVVVPADGLHRALYRPSLCIPRADADSMTRQMGPPLAFFRAWAPVVGSPFRATSQVPQ